MHTNKIFSNALFNTHIHLKVSKLVISGISISPLNTFRNWIPRLYFMVILYYDPEQYQWCSAIIILPNENYYINYSLNFLIFALKYFVGV